MCRAYLRLLALLYHQSANKTTANAVHLFRTRTKLPHNAYLIILGLRLSGADIARHPVERKLLMAALGVDSIHAQGKHPHETR